MTSKIDVLRAVINAWGERQDIDEVISHLTDDCVWHYSAVTQPPKIGHQGAREFLDAFKARVKNPRWRIFAYAENEDSLFVEGVDEFDTADGNKVQVPYAGVLDFRGDKISGWRDYFDRSVADMTGRGEALPAFAAKLIERERVA